MKTITERKRIERAGRRRSGQLRIVRSRYGGRHVHEHEWLKVQTLNVHKLGSYEWHYCSNCTTTRCVRT